MLAMLQKFTQTTYDGVRFPIVTKSNAEYGYRSSADNGHWSRSWVTYI